VGRGDKPNPPENPTVCLPALRVPMVCLSRGGVRECKGVEYNNRSTSKQEEYNKQECSQIYISISISTHGLPSNSTARRGKDVVSIVYSCNHKECKGV
jgi:hypothetical protein